QPGVRALERVGGVALAAVAERAVHALAVDEVAAPDRYGVDRGAARTVRGLTAVRAVDGEHRARAARGDGDAGCDPAPHHLRRNGLGWNALQACWASLNAGESGLNEPFAPAEPALERLVILKPPPEVSGSGRSTPCWRMHWANFSAWSRSSAC